MALAQSADADLSPLHWPALAESLLIVAEAVATAVVDSLTQGSHPAAAETVTNHKAKMKKGLDDQALFHLFK